MSIARIVLGILVVAGMNARAYEWKNYRTSVNVEDRRPKVDPAQPVVQSAAAETGQALKIAPRTFEMEFVESTENLFLKFKNFTTQDEDLRKCANFSVMRDRMQVLESEFKETNSIGTSMTRFKPVMQKMGAMARNLEATVSSVESSKCRLFKKSLAAYMKDVLDPGQKALKMEIDYEKGLKEISDHFQKQVTPEKPAEIGW